MLNSGYGYMVMTKNIHDISSIAINASCNYSLLADPNAHDNVYILVDYMKTGLLPFPELISK